MKKFFLFFVLLSSSVVADDWGSGRVSIFARAFQTEETGQSSSFSEIVGSISIHSPYNKEENLEFALDVRSAVYPSSDGRDPRVSIYNAYVGKHFGKMHARGGQMWLNELGALGSVGGGMFQYKQSMGATNILRFGTFGGLEPKILEAGYEENITKFGGFVAYDAEGGRSHTAGYVNLRNSGLTERSVIVFNNFLPLNSNFFLYQWAELDLSGPAGEGDGGLNYFFVNARGNPHPSVELQGTFHHGRSIDARTITEDHLNGRPVDPRELDGFRFESADFRATIKVYSDFYVFGSVGRDRNNRDEESTQRFTYGLFTNNVLNSGFDFRFSGTHYSPPDGSTYDSWSISAGKTFLEKVYVTVEYFSSLSVVVLNDDVLIETRPRTNRFDGSSIIHLNRSLSLQLSADVTDGDSYQEFGFLGGVIFRL